MKKLIITCALLTSASMLSFAQSTQTAPAPNAQQNAAPMQQHPQGPTAEAMAERRAARWKAQFNLNDEQYKGVYAAELDYMKQMVAAHDNHTQPSGAQREAMEKKKDAAFKAAMTPEQFQKYSDLRNARAIHPMQTVPAGAPATAPAPTQK